MSSVLRIACSVFAVALTLGATSTKSLADINAPDCAVRQNVLGVSRVVEIDATGGLRLGRMQYKDLSFLKQGEVVLTFDDGPLRRYSTVILNALEAECTKAMFFMLGHMAVTDPEMVREIDRRGHTIATHTWTHKNIKRQSRSRMEKQLELGFSAVSAALGKPASPFFRFPYLSDSKSAMKRLADRDVAMFSIDVDSKDYQTRSGEIMVGRIMRRLKRNGKGILLFHDIQRSTAKGIKALLRKLKRGGYKVVHIVSKTPVKTLPKYDIMALKELKRRKKSWGSRPMPGKKILWPISNSWLPATEPLTVIAPPAQTAKAKSGPTGSTSAATGSPGSESRSTKPSSLSSSGYKKLHSANTRRIRKTRKRKSTSRPIAQRRPPRLRPTVDPLQRQIYTD